MPRRRKKSTLAERLQHVLEVMQEERGWNKATMAREMGTEPNRLHHWLSGSRKTMSSRFAWPLQDKYRWNARWILDDDGPERIPAPDPEKDEVIEELRQLPVDRLRAIKSAVAP